MAYGTEKKTKNFTGIQYVVYDRLDISVADIFYDHFYNGFS